MTDDLAHYQMSAVQTWVHFLDVVDCQAEFYGQIPASVPSNYSVRVSPAWAGSWGGWGRGIGRDEAENKEEKDGNDEKERKKNSIGG